YKPGEAFKMDPEGSPPEATYERCKVWIRQCQAAMASLPPFTSSQYVDLAKSLPRPLLPATIVELTKYDDTEMEQVSFVNNIAAMKGGSHVNYITSQITSYLEGIFY
ncbi:DNA topoisomerase 2 isoform X2, partial [Tanacetum coccineum]